MLWCLSIDFIFEDIPFLKRWIELDWDTKWKHEWSEETSRQAAEYYFNTYAGASSCRCAQLWC